MFYIGNKFMKMCCRCMQMCNGCYTSMSNCITSTKYSKRCHRVKPNSLNEFSY